MVITEPLARLASLDFQRRYIIHGTRNGYMPPRKLLDDVDTVIRQIWTQARAISSPAIAAILALQPLLKTMVLPSGWDGLQQLVEGDRSWRAARAQAARCLDILAFDLRAWEEHSGEPGQARPSTAGTWQHPK